MAKQKYEVKKVVSAIGRLDKNENGEYVVVVEDKDDVEIYFLSDILRDIEGNIINISSDIL